MNRRSFFKFMGATVLGFTIPLRHLSPSIQLELATVDQLSAMTVEVLLPRLKANLFKRPPLLAYLKRQPTLSGGEAIRIPLV